MKVLFMGAVKAGKTALLAALQGHSLPEEKDRSIATRFQRMRLVFNKEGGFFEAVPVEEYRLKSMIGEKKVVLVEGEDGGGGEGGEGESETTGSVSSGPSAAIAPARPVPATSSLSSMPMTPSSPATPIASTASASALTMSAVQDLLKGELSEQHIDLDTFDFAGEKELTVSLCLE
jgi:GTPase SAR1 family protein